MKIIGTSKVAAQNKITLVEPVAGLLKIQQGNVLAFLQNTSGDIIIKKLSDIEMTAVES